LGEAKKWRRLTFIALSPAAGPECWHPARPFPGGPVIGALGFPKNGSIASLEAAAKAASSTGPFSLDAILFGKGRD
jgi:hypothetical protein